MPQNDDVEETPYTDEAKTLKETLTVAKMTGTYAKLTPEQAALVLDLLNW